MTWYLCGVDANDNITQYGISEHHQSCDAIASFIKAYPQTVAIWADVVPIQDLNREPDYIREAMEE